MKDKKYFSGLLTGILATLSVVLVVGIVFISVFGKNYGKNKVVDVPKTELSDSIEESEDAIFKKIKTLTYYLDQYSLYDIDDSEAIEGIYKGLFEGLGDNYSAYYTKDEYAKFMEATEGEYCGIGAYISQKETGEICIALPMDGSPAKKAGLRKDDILCQVDNHVISGEDSDTVVSWIKGEEGTSVKLKIMREGEADYLTFDIKREKIEVPTVEYTLKDNDIAYVTVSGFDSVTTAQFKSAMNSIKKDNAKGLIVDLRGNPGGNLAVVVDMLDLFIPKGKLIVYTEDKNGTRTEEDKAKNDVSVDLPMVVLIDGNSASASEIFAGAVQDYKLGTLVGEKSFGKGIVQTLLPLSDGSAIKFTTAKYFTPKGRYIHEKGIEPDVNVEFDAEKYYKNKIDNQYDKAVEELKKLIK